MIGFVRRSSTVDSKMGSGYRRFNGAYNTAFCNICNISPAVDDADENAKNKDLAATNSLR